MKRLGLTLFGAALFAASAFAQGTGGGGGVPSGGGGGGGAVSSVNGQTGAVKVASQGGTILASQQAGATDAAKFAACNTAAIAIKGTCDARDLTMTTVPSTEYVFGDTAGDPVTILLPVAATWKSSVTGATACVARHYSNATVISQSVGAGSTQMKFDTASSSQNIRAVYCTDRGSQTYGYFNAVGFGVYNTALATAPANIETSYAYDQSHFAIYGGPSNGTRSMWVHDQNSPVSYSGSQVYASQGYLASATTAGGDYTKGGTGLWVGPNVNEVTFDQFTANAPAVGFRNVVVQGSNTWGIKFSNYHFEGNCLADPTTEMVFIDGTVWGVSFDHGAILTECDNTVTPLNSTKFPIINTTYYNFHVSDTSTTAFTYIKDNAQGGATIASNGYGTPNGVYQSGFGTNPVGGIVFKSQTGPDVAASPAQVVAAIGATPVQKSLSAPPTSVTYTVAASNSTAAAKANATQVCTGTNDDVCINNVINMCGNSQTGVPGCTVMLRTGIYNVGACVNIDNDDVTLQGEARPMWGGYVGPYPVTAGSAVSLGTSQIRASVTGLNIICLTSLNKGGNGSTADQNRHRGITIEKLDLVGFNYTGTCISGDASTPDYNKYRDNMCEYVNNGFSLNDDSATISGNTIQYVAGSAIVTGGVNNRVYDNLLWDSGGIAISNTAQSATITGNSIGHVPNGISSSGGSSVISSNNFVSIGGYAVFCAGDSCAVNGNSVDNFRDPTYFPIPNRLAGALFSVTGIGSSVTGNTANQLLGQAIPMIALTGAGSIAYGNAAKGPFNFGGNPFSVPAGGNGYNFVPNAGPAAITTATLQARYRAGSLAQANNTTVTSWTDSSGFGGRNLGIFSGAPKYIAAGNVNAGPVVRFTGSNADVFQESEIQLPTTQPRTIFLVFNQTTHSGNNTIISANKNSQFFTRLDSGTNQVAVYAGTTALGGSTTVVGTGVSHVVEVVVNGASSRISMDGGTAVTINPNTAVWTYGMLIGGEVLTSNTTTALTTQNYFTGDIAEIVVYSGAASNSDGALVGAALCSTYAITCSTNW